MLFSSRKVKWPGLALLANLITLPKIDRFECFSFVSGVQLLKTRWHARYWQGNKLKAISFISFDAQKIHWFLKSKVRKNTTSELVAIYQLPSTKWPLALTSFKDDFLIEFLGINWIELDSFSIDELSFSKRPPIKKRPHCVLGLASCNSKTINVPSAHANSQSAESEESNAWILSNCWNSSFAFWRILSSFFQIDIPILGEHPFVDKQNMNWPLTHVPYIDHIQ